MRQVLEVLEILGEKRLVFEVKDGPQRIEHVGIGRQLILIPQHEIVDWVSGEKAGEEEVDRDGGPEGDHVEGESPDQERHVRISSPHTVLDLGGARRRSDAERSYPWERSLGVMDAT